MPEMAVCGKNKGVPAVHRHIKTHPREWHKEQHEQKVSWKVLKKKFLPALLKTDLGEDSTLPLMIWIFQTTSEMSAGASRDKNKISQNKLNEERVISGVRFVKGQV